MKVINGFKMFNTQELSELLDVSPATISIMRKKGLLPHTRIGRNYYTSEEALAEYLNGKTTELRRKEKAETK